MCKFNMCLCYLHAQSKFRFHNVFDNPFRQGFTTGELFNLGNHLAIGCSFVFQILCVVIIHVVHFGNPVQPVDAGIPTGQTFF